MKIPPGKTEQEVIDAIERSIRSLAPRFVFGTHDVEDMKQLGWVKALELLETEKYDPSRPLANFIFCHLRNRYLNYVRDHLYRSDPPCPRCHAGEPCSPDGLCQKYKEWRNRNRTKANLQAPLALDHVADEHEPGTRIESNVLDNLEQAEALRLIDEHLPVELRSYYVQMRAGVSVPKQRRLEVIAFCQEILACQSRKAA